MRCITATVVVTLLLVAGPALAGHGGGHGGHGHGGGHGWGHGGGWHHGHGPEFFGGFVYDPWFWDPFFFPYAYPAYVPPPDDEVPDAAAGWSTAGDAGGMEDPLDASYGLVQLRGVPDGATVELDGRYWLGAARLGDRWLALPRGGHTITVRRDAATAVERRVDIEPGTTAVVRFDTAR